MLIVVSYDLPNDRRRTKLAHNLKDFGVRVQYSVFECILEAEQVDALRVRITRLIDPSEDRVRIYRFCEDCGTKTELLGLSEPTEDRDVYVL